MPVTPRIYRSPGCRVAAALVCCSPVWSCSRSLIVRLPCLVVGQQSCNRAVKPIGHAATGARLGTPTTQSWQRLAGSRALLTPTAASLKSSHAPGSRTRLIPPAGARLGDELRTILSVLPQEGRQTLLFSGTMTKSLIQLQIIALLKDVKEVYLAHVLERLAEHKVRSAIIFSSTCKGCHLLSIILEQLGLRCASLHSGKPQKQRIAALTRFKSEAVPLLLATDVASRGLDIPTVDLVINYDLPIKASDYVHRIGRTARAGRHGWSLSFVTQHDVGLVHKIEELIGHQLVEFKTEEAEVLKGITKVYAARRAAMLQVAEEDGLDTSDKRTKRLVKRLGKGGKCPEE